jgi:hypothetical protein
MSDLIIELLKEIKNYQDAEKKLFKEIKNILNQDNINLSKKLHKHLKKLNYYLEGGEELNKDVIVSIEKYINKKDDEE